jgi:Tol biopolymer transport system component/DNA-binding winged helix-turn-helix (wHTH) protein
VKRCDEIMMKLANVTYRFGDIQLDVQNLELRVQGEIRPLEPKTFRLLQFLVENPGRAIPKEEILAAVWHDTIVTDNALTRAVTQVRKALNDDAKHPRYIETVPTIGYRFLGELLTDSPDQLPPAPARPAKWIVAGGLALAMITAALVWMSRTPAKLASAGFRTTAQFSYGQGLDVNATFSADGKLVAYASDRSGSFEIYVRALDPSARELQLTSNGNQNLFPSFSPDGQFVVFSSMRTPGLFRVPALGGSIRRLTDFGTHPAWSPDGRQIVFASHARASLSTTDYYWAADSTLWLVPAEGGTPLQITTRSKPEGGQTFPSWSADGKQIRFVNYGAGKASIWTYRLSDGVLEHRFSRDKATTLGSATFSRDDRTLFYVSSNLNGDIGIWRLNLNPRTLKSESEPEPVFRPGLGVPRDLSLSPDGKRVVFSAVLSSSQVLIQRMKGYQVAGEPFSVTHATSYRYAQAKWLPDSKSFIYTNWPAGQRPQIWQAKLDGSQATPISPDNSAQYFGGTLADGQSVLFVDENAKASLRVRRASLTDGSVRTLAESATALGHVNFSSDGSAAVYHDNGVAPHVWKIDLGTGVKTRLTPDGVSAGFPHFTPDAKGSACRS